MTDLLLSVLMSRLNKESDLAVAIVAASIVEAALEHALRIFLHHNKKIADSLFRTSNPRDCRSSESYTDHCQDVTRLLLGKSTTSRVRQELDSTFKLRITSLRIADIEWHHDEGCDAAALESLTVDRNIGNRQQQQAAVR